jgi:hydroxymethylpyrimidine pyrophosphatase-like HAD family hydrolase
MPPRRFDAVICDIDGCLAPESSDPFDTAALARIAEHNRRAQQDQDRPVVTLCSGRPEPFVESICRAIGNRTLPAIAENGVWLFHPDLNGWDRDPSISADHLRTVQEAQQWVQATLGPRGVVMQPGKTASLSLYHPDTAFLRTLERPVRDEFARRGWHFRVSMTWLYINCDLAHISKGTAIDRLMAQTGLNTERLAGIGDTDGDRYIAERVSWFACPGNAGEAIRRRAHFIAESHEIQGVLEILARLSPGAGPA